MHKLYCYTSLYATLAMLSTLCVARASDEEYVSDSSDEEYVSDSSDDTGYLGDSESSYEEGRVEQGEMYWPAHDATPKQKEPILNKALLALISGQEANVDAETKADLQYIFFMLLGYGIDKTAWPDYVQLSLGHSTTPRVYQLTPNPPSPPTICYLTKS